MAIKSVFMVNYNKAFYTRKFDCFRERSGYEPNLAYKSAEKKSPHRDGVAAAAAAAAAALFDDDSVEEVEQVDKRLVAALTNTELLQQWNSLRPTIRSLENVTFASAHVVQAEERLAATTPSLERGEAADGGIAPENDAGGAAIGATAGAIDKWDSEDDDGAVSTGSNRCSGDNDIDESCLTPLSAYLEEPVSHIPSPHPPFDMSRDSDRWSSDDEEFVFGRFLNEEKGDEKKSDKPPKSVTPEEDKMDEKEEGSRISADAADVLVMPEEKGEKMKNRVSAVSATAAEEENLVDSDEDLFAEASHDDDGKAVLVRGDEGVKIATKKRENEVMIIELTKTDPKKVKLSLDVTF